jgi:ribonuclease G
MAKEICISSTPHETRLAILEDDQLAEIYYERENEYTLAGSIYNGRVTRVLPGMQSAFVDIGLERDAFLYVTDFIELEDQEETDELEKAAASGANQAPREVRHTGAGGRNGQKPEQRQDRPAKERQPEEEAAPAAAAIATPVEPPSISEQPENEQKDFDATGTRRWRGRRHRRGSRGSSEASEARTASSETIEIVPEQPSETEAAPEVQAAPGRHAAEKSPSPEWSAPTPAPRSQKAPEPFVLPGESLSKYGGTPDEEESKPAQEPAAPVRPVSHFKPSTLIETPIKWDGSGLLPGESLSKHRSSEPEVEAETAPETVADAEDASFVETVEESAQPASPYSFNEAESQELAPEFEFEEEDLVEDLLQPSTPEESEPEPEAEASAEAGADETKEPESGSSASYRVDPAAPSGFRLFGLGKKKEEKKPAKPASTYAPGSGLIEEEVIEGEEFDATPRRHQHKPGEHDPYEYEEETLPKKGRSGGPDETPRSRRFPMNITEKSGEDGESFDESESEETSSEAQPSNGDATSPQRRERGGRGRRGRGTTAPAQGNRRGPSRRSMQTSDLPIISDLLKSGQEILVQIAKEPIAKKGARITSHIALPGRFLVFMPTVTHVGVSRKISSDDERQRLKKILVHERGEASGGFIVRTAAEGASEEDLRADLRFLMNLWNDIKQRSDSSKSPALIYHDLSLIERILRDQVSSNFSNIWVDSEANYERIVRFLNRFSPTLVRRVKLYTKETPLFEQFNIEDEISKALRSKVWLKSGGSIVINQTEALVAIDVNTGKYVGKSARLEDTIVKTNLDAVPEIVRQVRLRDLGGIIIIDFIDMDDRKNRYKVMAALEEALKADRAPTKVLQFNDFGLVAITRKRVKQSLERTLSVPCPTCQATGMVKSPTTVCNEIYTELRKMKKHFEGEDVMLRVNPETVKILKSNNASWLAEFEELVGKNILVKSDPTLHPEQFDIQG